MVNYITNGLKKLVVTLLITNYTGWHLSICGTAFNGLKHDNNDTII
jgi:hypothetical protein